MTYQDSMRFVISGLLWIQQLSITITEFGEGKGCIQSRVLSMNLWNVVVSKAPSMMSQWSTPSSSDSAGSTEYLKVICVSHFISRYPQFSLLTSFRSRRTPSWWPCCHGLPKPTCDMWYIDQQHSHQRKQADLHHKSLYEQQSQLIFQHCVRSQHVRAV